MKVLSMSPFFGWTIPARIIALNQGKATFLPRIPFRRDMTQDLSQKIRMILTEGQVKPLSGGNEGSGA
jgi:hypothetical protein